VLRGFVFQKSKNTMHYLTFLLVLLAACQAPRFTAQSADRTADRAWRDAAQIAQRIKAPVFPDRDFVVADLQVNNCRSAIQKAIETCHAVGGGRVVLPAGNYLCDGPLHLRSNVNLHLQKGATLVFDTLPGQYLPLVKVRWEGTVCWNYSPLIYAFQQKNIALTGEGSINGQSLAYWKNWRARQDPAKKRLRQMGNDRSPEDERRFGEGWWLRPSLIEFYECENILVEGLTLQQSPFWTLHPVFSKNIICRKLNIRGGFLNDDGIDPDSCTDVLIEDCNIHTDDDAISVKAGRDQDAWNRSGTRRVLVRRCTLHSEKANALCIGSELSGGVEQVFFEDCHIKFAKYGLNFKTNNDRGGHVKNIFVRNIKADSCQDHLLFFQTNYHSYRGGNFPTTFSDFFLQNIDCQKVGSNSVRMNGLPSAPIRRVFLDNTRVGEAPLPPLVEHVEGLVEKK
jgi:polygalacturonase